MNELDAARQIVLGRLPSGWKFENVWLFAMRITGTGASYRVGLKEFCWRDPSIYLNDEFLARCNGLPVILDHPAEAVLNSNEFNKRVVGTIFLPYIKGEEVWGVAKIFDEPTALLMQNIQLSTSPCVVLRNSDENTTVSLDDDTKLLIEGNPTLLDHLAICEQGVWDKGGDPVGVLSDGGSVVAEDKKKPDAMPEDKKPDAEPSADIHSKLDAIMDCIGAMKSRQDSMEARMADAAKPESKPDAKPEVEAARKDVEAEAAAAKEREDKARKDAEEMKARMDALENRTKERPDSDAAEMAGAQARGDSIASLFGERAPRPFSGENPTAYRLRVLRAFQKHSPVWKDADLDKICADSVALGVIEKQVYADAQANARNPAAIPLGELREIVRKVGSHEVHEFVGTPRAWMAQFSGVTHRARMQPQKAA